MKIGIDGGALCGNRFGNYIYTYNLIKAINLYDKKNDYVVYSFCNLPKELKLNKNIIFKKIFPKKFWMKLSVSINDIVDKNDIFLGLNQSYPISNSRKIIVSHGLSFKYFKDLYTDSYKKMLNQINKINNKKFTLLVSSDKVKKELQSLNFLVKNLKKIEFGIPFDFHKKLKNTKQNFFLTVSVNHPIKNIVFLINCFENFNKKNAYKYNLVIVTNKKYEINNNNVKQITKITRKNLKNLYSKAKAYLLTSHYESFNFPILEALSQNTPVVALKGAVIPELSKYVNTVNTKEDFINQIQKVIKQPKTINISELKKEFSWKKYIETLISLY